MWRTSGVRDKQVEFYKIAGEVNMADLLTKHLSRAVLDRHVAAIGYSEG